MIAYSTITIERGDEEQLVELEVECRFDCHKAIKGQRDSLGGVRGAGPPLQPDEPASADFEGAMVLTIDGKPAVEFGEIELTHREVDGAREALSQSMEDEE